MPALRRQHRDPLDLGDPATLEQADAQGAGRLAVDRCQQMARRVVCASNSSASAIFCSSTNTAG